MKVRFISLTVFLSFLFQFSLQAQIPEENYYKFVVIKELPHTPVKNQARTQTCWSFSGLSFLESEILRMGKPEVDLSEMFVVNYCYRNKAPKYVRMQGKTNFGPGGIFCDVLDVTRNYGLVPEEVYPGIKYNSDKHDHAEMDEVLKKMVDAVVENKGNKLTTVWPDALNETVDSYLGQIPDSFEYRQRKYTPKSFDSNYCGINPDDYVQITSFSHHPFYKPFILEVPDNWSWSDFYNVPLDEMEEIIDYSLNKGYTVAWAADVTDKGFATTKSGLAAVPDIASVDSVQVADSKSDSISGKKESTKFDFSKRFKEKTISQEMRQIAFNDQETTDDHGMHIIGLARDQNGKVYYMVKNSWGVYNDYGGYFYASKAYMRYKTTSILVNKNSIPNDIRKKLGI